MLFQVMADFVLVLHLAFILFVALGGFAVLRWPQVAIGHLPALLWGVSSELGGWICPLTYAENYLRALGGKAPFENSFIEHYLLPVIYPRALTPAMQIAIAIALIVVNSALYFVLRRRRYRVARAR